LAYTAKLVLILAFESVVEYTADFAVSVTVEAVLCAGWAVLYARYAVRSTVPAYRIVFILLACGAVLPFVGNGFYYYFVDSISLDSSFAQGWLMASGFTFIFNTSAYLLWTVCLFVIAFHEKANLRLKVSAALLALIYLCLVAYEVLITFGNYEMIPIVSWLDDDISIYLLIAVILTIVVIYLGLSIFFFASLAFSKPRQPESEDMPEKQQSM
jgi:hypothetical protein